MSWKKLVKRRKKPCCIPSVSRLMVCLSVMVAREQDYFRLVRSCGVPKSEEEAEEIVNRVDAVYYRLLCSIADLKNECDLFRDSGGSVDFPFSVQENYKRAVLCYKSNSEKSVVDLAKNALAVAEIAFACSRGSDEIVERCSNGNT